jgi:NitT/TauT family transport system substrate-binding protein
MLAVLMATVTLVAAEPIKIGYSDWPGWTAWEIAKEKGLFKKHGVEVELVWFPIYTDSLNALNTGQLDANCQTWSDTMFPLGQNIPLKVVLANDNSFGNDGLIAKPGIKTIADLKGKTVATELATVDHFLLLQALAKNGMKESDIVFKNLTVPDASAAFLAGQLDAAVIWQPWLYSIVKEKKGNLLFTSADVPGLIPDLLVFKAETVEKRADEIQKIVDTWFDVVAFIRSNEDEAIAIMAKVVDQKPEDYKVFLPGTKFFDLAANKTTFTKTADDGSLYGSGKTIAEFLVSIEQLPSVPAYEAALEPKFIEAAKK